MNKRKLLYVALIVATELVSNDLNLQASPTQEAVKQPQSTYINISQEKYEELLKYKFLYEEYGSSTKAPDEREYAISIAGANEKIEQAYKEVNRLTTDLSASKLNIERLEAIIDDKKIHFIVGGSVLSDIEGHVGFGAELSARYKKYEPFLGVDYYQDRLLFRIGGRYMVK